MHAINPKNLPKIAYHRSNPLFRDNISEQGLIPTPPSDGWIDGNISLISPNGETALFATLTTNKDEAFCHGYDDDLYLIDLTKLDNQWFADPYIEGEFIEDDSLIRYAFTRQPIPLTAIRLIHKGTGEAYC